MADIVLDEITKRFPDGALAVDKFSMDIADGEFVILVGPSGCGKSTTLNMIAGLEDITQHLDRRPANLSGGQRQRVAMGRAIVRDPSVFLMDEPLSNLDAKLRVQMRAEIHKLQRELGVTTIYVTHDQTEAMTMGDRVAVMLAGHLQQVDAPERLYERPANQFVAGFIGSPAMNMVEARLNREGDDLIVSFGA